MAQLILVSSWAAAIFPDWKPHPNTLRNWVHNGKIRPAPKKIGNKYFCDPKAEYGALAVALAAHLASTRGEGPGPAAEYLTRLREALGDEGAELLA